MDKRMTNNLMPQGYKLTDLGVIPEDWAVVRLGEVVSVHDGTHQTPHYVNDGYSFYSVENVSNNDFVNTKYISKEEHTKLTANYKIEKGDVLMTRIGSIGVCKFVDWQPDASFYVSLALLKTKGIDAGYLTQASNSKYFKKEMLLNSLQFAIPQKINLGKIGDVRIFIPSIYEQQKIAEALRDIDLLIEGLKQKIAKKRAIKEGVMQQLLTGKKRLAGFSEPWVERRLGDIGQTYNGLTGKKASDFGCGDAQYIPFLNILMNPCIDINNLESVRVKSNELQNRTQCGDLFFNTSSETPEEVGMCSVLQTNVDNLYLNSFCFGFRLFDKELISGSYLSYFFRSRRGRELMGELAQGATRYNLAKANFLQARISISSNVLEQQALAQILTDMDNEIAELEQKQKKYTTLKQGAMQKLLTGQIRLVDTPVVAKQHKANDYFKRSVWAGEIIDRVHEEPTFGHVKMVKLLFLTEKLSGINIGSNYHRDAAGPYDNRAIRSIDSQIKIQKWFEAKRTDKGYRYIALSKRGGHKKYFDQYFLEYKDVFDRVIKTMQKWDTEHCEIVATLYSAWEDLIISKKEFDDDDVVDEVLNNWHESKKRIERERWLSALNWMRDNSFTPKILE